jgi:Flp pilus assembly pilin Flp
VRHAGFALARLTPDLKARSSARGGHARKEMTMRGILEALWCQEQGQDLVEYTLLIAFITFATAALFLLGTGGATQGIWSTTNSQLTAANASAS